ncbi:aldo/keto reductase [Teredinibacter turnerae]|uniref:aldo/keto reductase n=1 Tax=Teredinibacter turnerae TaxID=2426 RepID=UPI0030CD7232
MYLKPCSAISSVTTTPRLNRQNKLALGAAPLGNLYSPVSESDAQATILAAINAGLQFIDTAPFYGFGISEKRIGNALHLAGSLDIPIATKVGRILQPTADRLPQSRDSFFSNAPYHARFDYSFNGIMQSFETSCERLKRSYIDLVLVHDLDEVTHPNAFSQHWDYWQQGGFQALQQLKSAGKIGATGLGTKDVGSALKIIQDTAPDYLLIAGRYTLLDTTAEKNLFPVCEARGIKIISAAPFNSGILANERGKRSDFYEYTLAPPAILEKVKQLENLCKEWNIPLPAAALQFPMQHPLVETVVAGFRSELELTDGVRLSNLKIPDAFWKSLRALHRRWN